MKLGLGTVQFGLDYGISNKTGITSADEAKEVLSLAHAEGVRVLDTAPSYGKSEQILGTCTSSESKFRIVTKISTQIELGHSLRETFNKSLRKLNTSSVYGLLVHQPNDLIGPQGPAIYEELLALKDQKLVSKIGVSVYDQAQIDKIFERFKLDLIQLPLNVFDQRLIRSGHLRHLKEIGIEIHSRSVFLQGLLLMSPQDLPERLNAARPFLTQFNIENEKRGLSSLEAALTFALKCKEIDTVLCGVNNRVQLVDILQSVVKSDSLRIDEDYLSGLSLTDETLLNPSLWESTH